MNHKIIFFVFIFSGLALSQPLQKDKLVFHFHNQSLRQALQEISEKTNVRFIFDDELVDGKSLNTKVTSDSLAGVLKTILSENNLGYKRIASGKIVLYRAEQNLIRGYVLDGENGEALPYANILLKGTRRGTSSNTDGFFALANKTAAPCTLSVTYIGYQPGEVIADVPGGTHPLKVKMQQQPLSSAPVLVEANREPAIQFSERPGKLKISPAKIKSVPAPMRADIQRAMHFLPGISSVDERPEGLYVFGGTPDQNLVLFDGIPIYKPTHFYGLTSLFHSSAIRNVDVFLGGFPANYGDRLSSVIAYHSSSALQKPLSWNLGVDLLSAQTSMQIPLGKKMGISFSARRSLNDVRKNPLYSELYSYSAHREFYKPAPPYLFWDITGRFDLKSSPNETFSLSVFTGQDFVDRSNTFGSYYSKPDLNKWANKGAALQWRRDWNDKINSGMSFTVSDYSSKFKIKDSFPYGYTYSTGGIFFQDENNLTNWAAKFHGTIKPLRQFSSTVGFEFEKINFSFSRQRMFADQGSRQKTDLATQKQVMYLQNELKIFRGSQLSFGIRAIHFNYGGSKELDPRVSFSQQFSHFSVKASWGQYHQYVQQIFGDDIFKGNSTAIIISGKPAFSEHRLFQLQYTAGSFHFISMIYSKDYNDILIPTNENDFFEPGSGSSNGMILSLQREAEHFNGWINYKWGKTQYSIPGFNNNKNFSANFEREHELSIVGQVKWANWQVSATGVLASGKPFTPVSYIHTIEFINSDKQKYIHKGEINSALLPNYYRVDLGASKKIGNIWGMNFEFGVALLNLLARKNSWGMEYSVWGDRVYEKSLSMMYTTRMVFINVGFN